MPANVPGIAGYGANASALADQYESIGFADNYREVLQLFPKPPAHVLDIGAGTGRDAAALTRLGYTVVAVEPTQEMRSEGTRRHGGLDIHWMDDHLPALSSVRAHNQQFDLVLLSAVWMHLDLAERHAAMASVAALVTNGGLVCISLRHGPVPPGRRMFEVSGAETAALAATQALEPVFSCLREDKLGRSGVSWTFIVLRKGS